MWFGGGGRRRACVRAKRPRVHRHHAHMSNNMWTWCRCTRGRFVCAHGGVLESTYGFFHIFSVSHTKHTHHDHNYTHHTPQHTTPHGDTDGERDRERRQRERREDEREETRQNNRRQRKTGQHEREERRHMIDFQCGGAWPFLVDVVLCLVHPVNDRVFSLLNRV